MSEPSGDLIIRGGFVLDHVSGSFRRGAVRISGGRIAPEVGVEAPGTRVLDVGGALVTAGLVDLHTHVFAGQDLGVPPDAVGPPSGVTTLIDAGSAGGHLIDAFRSGVIERAVVRVRPFLNIASIGTTSIYLGGELRAGYYTHEDTAVAAIERHRDLVVGVKVRASGDVGGERSPEALRCARSVADRVGLPLMVHLGPPPETVDRILEVLGPGDILTHCFTGWEGNTVLQDDGPRASVRAARERGVVFDLGHGQSGFDAVLAARMLAAGFAPDTLSTDIHAVSQARVVGLASVLSRLMALGMSVEEVLLRATIAPARAVGLDVHGIGTLAQGAPGDVAVFRLEPSAIAHADGFGNQVQVPLELVPVLTVVGGRIVHDRLAAAS